MDRILIVGSGASGVHFALSVLQKGYDVVMLDVGHEKPEMVNPDDGFMALKRNLEDPARYFLGERYESLILPDSDSEYYGLPPSKNYVLRAPQEFRYKASGFAPLFSFARGGLAEVWTGGVYPFNDRELEGFPFRYDGFGPYYGEVAKRIGISGANDDLSRFHPFHENIMPPLRMDSHSACLLAEYERQKMDLNEGLRCYMGRSRVATLSADKGDRKGCTYSGRCLWGCAEDALYTPSITLRECMGYSNFTYIPGMYATHFEYDARRQVTSIAAHSVANGSQEEFRADKFVLAAGTLLSSKIFMDSIFVKTGEIVRLNGLMDNRQILVPFVNLRMIGNTYDPDSYQYHQVVMGIESERPEEYVHGQITTLKTAMYHPIIKGLPFDVKTSMSAFRKLHAALGVVNVNLRDSRREDNFLSLEKDQKSAFTNLQIRYAPRNGEGEYIRRAVSTVKRVLRKLGCVAPSPMIHVRPMGASVHYSGTIPMAPGTASFTASEVCQSRDFGNLYFVDGTTFPSLPAKNLTFSLMANAIRVADNAF